MAATTVSSSGASPAARVCSSEPSTVVRPSVRLPRASGSSPRRSASRVDLPLPLRPVTARRSPGRRSRSSGPSSKSPRRATAPSRRSTRSPSLGAGAQREPQLPRLERLVGQLVPLEQLLRLAHLAAERVRGAPVLAAGLVAQPGTERPRLGAPARQEVGELATPLLRLLEGRPGGSPRLVPLLRVVAPAARELGHGRRPRVDLRDPRDGAVEERAVVRDDGEAALVRVEEALETVEAVEVEVVRRLVEQQDVEAGEQDRGEAGACRLAARERRRLLLERHREPEVGTERARPRLRGRRRRAR